ncbi:SRPBCC family protein [Mycobacterium shimoidei]|uniref:Activator of Hsp90 ATPase 1 family protein [Candidatus Solibacter usitatus] n=1 Tax=Mycobacterium shimoidei TaxID=29313 RepID=A0A1E3TIS4_MYCSH|nr:SRPBCC family protein [Mycobacterium shimoidei]MCV7257306.1 SRPBCC family protein [Mycobacterium shimoidei]ODR14357.1 vanillate O-demethylase oxidoreductase VanB [Mycobacterium shimoidei]ORW80434.1 vanillate O-demethylase oxidoreductase VanB [Mycobacterium shimoidei]SRX96005.1 activator of Hsp90 ATPase 1 family protein [Candidatus Solibacter usitatus] [Mycobacterium shimoidei]
MNTDRIEKQVLLRAPLDRVWRAISDSDQFGQWFGARFDGPFVAGTSVTATITPTTVDDEVAKLQEPHAGTTSTWQIVAVEPRTKLAYRWHPCAGEPDADHEPTTLVEFTLAETSDGVLLTIVESGFDALAEPRRSSAFEANSGGWGHQVELVRKYLGAEQRV